MEDYEKKFPNKNLQVLAKYDTVYTSDSVEWCPIKGFEHIFVCGNYQVVGDTSNGRSLAVETQYYTPKERVGRILLFSYKEELVLHQTIDTEAILDQKWCHNPINNEVILGVTNSKKTIQIYKLNTATITLDLITSLTIEDDERETLILSLDWSTGKYSNNPEIVCSDSKGNVHNLSFDNNKLILRNSWNAHQFEVWISAFDYWNNNVFFTGGDDSYFCKFDKRIGKETIAKNRVHECGVTSLHSNIDREYLIASGSYDSYVRLWDMRKMNTPTNTLKVPGTIWRLKWNPLNTKYLLSACMNAGFHIIEAKELMEMKLVESFYEHKDLAYGADWSYLETPDDATIIGTSSFYDHLLCVSKVHLDELTGPCYKYPPSGTEGAGVMLRNLLRNNGNFHYDDGL